MVRLMLVSAPAFVLLGAIGISNLLHVYASDLREGRKPASGEVAAGAKEEHKASSGAIREEREGLACFFDCPCLPPAQPGSGCNSHS